MCYLQQSLRMNYSLFALLVILTCAINLGNFYVIRYDGGGTFDYTYDGLGNYQYKADLPDQKREEQGTVDTSKAGEDSYLVKGTYSFSSGGKLYKVSYVADADGYRTHSEDGVSYNGPKQPLPPGIERPLFKSDVVEKYDVTTEDPINKHALGVILGSKQQGSLLGL